MWQYWALLLIPAFWAILRAQPMSEVPSAAGQTNSRRWPDLWRIVFIALTFVVGLRHQVGGDWASYLGYIDAASHQSFLEAVKNTDPAYGMLNWLAVQFDLGVHWVNLVCAGLFASGLLTFCRAQPRPWLAVVIAVPYLITVVAMGYTRQGVAIGLAMLALVALGEGRSVRFFLWLALAATFHKSAVILVPLAVLAGSRRRLFMLFWIAIVGVVLFVLLLQESLNFMVQGYVGDKYESSGAAIRIAMNALPALIFLIFRRRFQITTAERSFWTWMALGALAFVLLLKISPSSTAVDRVALYWIPLQLFVWSRIPDALGQSAGGRVFWSASVVCYSVAVLFVWLVFGDHAFYWLPYQFYPWVWLWQ